ncbi:hypothetical protein [Sphingomonas bacterium]|uniref:hypothetical protein n=1 Tax=Sphingomonas bacterium TaxID=1895847 RepID=UPI001576968F|nr:hypothetical protein [Sphingomonas bacterium]
MKLILASILVASLSPVAAQQLPAQQPPVQGGPVTYGPGHKLCSDWSAAETKADPSEYAGNRFFVAGVMSAYNIYVSPPGFDIGRGLTPDDMKGFMHAQCAAHPTETIAAAATAFVAMMKTRQGK